MPKFYPEDDEEYTTQNWQPTVFKKSGTGSKTNVSTDQTPKFEWHYINTVKQTRKQRGWSTQFLADRVKTSVETINRLEKGDLSFDKKLQSDLNRALGLKNP